MTTQGHALFTLILPRTPYPLLILAAALSMPPRQPIQHSPYTIVGTFVCAKQNSTHNTARTDIPNTDVIIPNTDFLIYIKTHLSLKYIPRPSTMPYYQIRCVINRTAVINLTFSPYSC